MKKIFENKKIVLLLIIIGLLVFGGWSFLKPKELTEQIEASKPIDIGNPQKGDFVKVGKMSEPRYNHEAILLDDGRVLVFGGKTIRKDFEGG